MYNKLKFEYYGERHVGHLLIASPQVSESDTLPLQLCENCANILVAWHELSEGCLSAERKLLEMQDTQLRDKQQVKIMRNLCLIL